MRKSTLRLYLPFIGLAAVQALLIAFLPSTGGSKSQLAGGLGNSGSGAVSAGAGGTSGGATGTDTGSAAAGANGVGGSSGGGSGSFGGTGTAAAGGKAVQTASGLVTGDVSHCKGEKQFDIKLFNGTPPCIPKFTGDNGGATYQGVTSTSIKVVFFASKPNDQVDAILGTQGLAVPYAESVAYDQLAIAFVQKNFELYGRKIDAQFIQGDCPTTPPDYDKCNAEAQNVAKLHPFLVIWGTPLYGSVFDIWAKAGIPSFGGWQFDDSLFNTRRPFRWDPFMDGTQIGAHLAEYYCKKMVGHNADHSGQVIHATIGARGQVARKLGIITPEIEANVLAAKHVIAAVKACGGGEVPLFTYESNIETATQQTQTTVSNLIQNKVTTVACMCDPIAPAFLTSGMTGNSYFPEFLLTGTQFIDADLVGRLYDKQQMAHAFGISSIGAPVPLDQNDAAKVWQAMGQAGHPCEKNGCGINWAYVDLLGIALQQAGPNLNPLTLEKGLMSLPPDGGWDASGHKPAIVLGKYGQNDYTGVSDIREVYWDANATSPVDGSAGAYVNVNGGRRYILGQWSGNLDAIPVAAQ